MKDTKVLALVAVGLIASGSYYLYKGQSCPELNKSLYQRRQTIMAKFMKDCNGDSECMLGVQQEHERIYNFDLQVYLSEGCGQ